MNKEQALHHFYSSFDWPAYDETTIPDEAELPYITYEVNTSKIDSTVYLAASLWDRSTSWRSVTEKAEEIGRYLDMGGSTIPFEDGMLYIVQGSPYAQRAADDDDSIRRINLNFEAEFISAY